MTFSNAKARNENLRDLFEVEKYHFLQMPGEDRSVPLQTLFDTASTRAEALISGKIPVSQDICKETLDELDKCASLIDHLSIFSFNESFEDVNTSYICYFLVNYYRGALTAILKGESRKSLLERTNFYYDRFISLLTDYGITEFARNERPQCLDPHAMRSRKVEEYHRRKDIEEREALIKDEIKRKACDCDEELVREYYRLKIVNAAAKTLEEQQIISRELEILKAKKRTQGESQEVREKPSTSNFQASLVEHLTIVENDYSSIKNSVFNWGLSKPVMTVDQFLEHQLKTTKPLSNGTEIKKEEDVDCDNNPELLDAKTIKERQWDEYKDTNPSGWGNRYNRG